MNEWVWSIGGMVLTGENWSTGRETLYSVGGRWMNGYGVLVEWYWQGKTEILGEKHYIARVVGEWIGMEHWWNDTDRGKLKHLVKNPIPCQLSNKISTWTDPVSNPGLRGERPGTKCLSDGTATVKPQYNYIILNIQSVPHTKHSLSVIKTSQLMLYREIIAVFFLRSAQNT